MRFRLLLWATALTLLADQFSKFLVIHVMDVAHRGSIDVLPPLLVFRYGENRGINFGLFQGDGDAGRWLLIGLSLVICAVVMIWLRRGVRSKLMLVSGGLLIGGALGNVVDRLVFGYVQDFLNMSCCGIQNPFVFNIADVFIFAGAVGLVMLDGKKAP